MKLLMTGSVALNVNQARTMNSSRALLFPMQQKYLRESCVIPSMSCQQRALREAGGAGRPLAGHAEDYARSPLLFWMHLVQQPLPSAQQPDFS